MQHGFQTLVEDGGDAGGEQLVEGGVSFVGQLGEMGGDVRLLHDGLLPIDLGGG